MDMKPQTSFYHRRKAFILSCFIVLVLIILFIHSRYARTDFRYALRSVPQNAFTFINPKTQNQFLFTAAQQQRYTQNYLNHYYGPWAPDYLNYFPALVSPIKNNDEIKALIQNKIDDYLDHPGFGINRLPNSKEWMKSIVDNMDMGHFPNTHLRVITINNVSMRDLPTSQPSFGNWNDPGEGYPFDYIQVTTVAANTPAIVMQRTKDQLWSLIFTKDSYGWVPTATLAFVDDAFIREWQAHNYLTLTQNNIVIMDENGGVRFASDIGKIFPRTDTGILIAVADANQKAVIKLAHLNDKVAVPWPIPAIPHNFAVIINNMLGVKYGWGGMTGDCDCSFTTMDLYSAFGIWLPRNSSEQPFAGQRIKLSPSDNRKERTQNIIANGIPFLTLLHMPGHIVVYIGAKNHRIYTFQTAWGVHTENIFGQEGRAIIGNTVIAPADLGKNYLNVHRTWLDKIDSMIIFK